MKDLYKIYPQMKFYYDSKISKKRYVPYAMLSSPINFSNKCITTCSRGFRISSDGNEKFSVDNLDQYDSINIIIGGSTVFGVGSSNNLNTMSSLLTLKTKSIWLNLGIRAGNSFSEYIHLVNLLHRAKKIDNIIFLSGINDLYLSFLNIDETEFDYGFFPSRIDKENISILNKINQFFSQKFSNLRSKSDNNEYIIDEIIKNYQIKYSRNFQLISSLIQVYNCQVKFILQPFAPWTEKPFSENENKAFNILESIQLNSDWNQIKKLMGDKFIHQSINNLFNSLSIDYNIEFINSNNLFDKTMEDCFVDSIHLTDNGNKILSQLIYDKTNN